MKNAQKKPPKTAAGIFERWGYGTPEERWESKVDQVILFIARLGWSTVELTNLFHIKGSEIGRQKWSTRGGLSTEP